MSNSAIDALAQVIRDMADHGPRVALENAADWLNSHDAVEPEDVPFYERAVARADAEGWGRTPEGTVGDATDE